MGKKKKKKLKQYNIAICDTETTGLECDTHEIIEIGVILYNPQKDLVIKEWSRKAAPRNIRTASEYALTINGYDDNPKSYSDNIESVIDEFYKLVKGHIIMGQNIQFDVDFISKYLIEFGTQYDFDRCRKLELSSMVYPAIYKTDLRSTSLFALCEYFGVSNEGEHSALVDCRRTLEVYRCLMKNYKI